MGVDANDHRFMAGFLLVLVAGGVDGVLTVIWPAGGTETTYTVTVFGDGSPPLTNDVVVQVEAGATTTTVAYSLEYTLLPGQSFQI